MSGAYARTFGIERRLVYGFDGYIYALLGDIVILEIRSTFV